MCECLLRATPLSLDRAYLLAVESSQYGVVTLDKVEESAVHLTRSRA
jgi:hypothetical protein